MPASGWRTRKRNSSGSLAGGLNACVECCDRWAAGRVALRWEDQHGHRETLTFADLKERAARFANVLKARGIGPGDVVACMLPRVPDLMTVALGTWRAGAVYQPLFTAFGPKAIEHRLKTSNAKLVVTDPANRAKLDEIPNAPLIAVTTPVAGAAPMRPGDLDFARELAAASPDFAPVMRKGDDLFLLMSTSGTTGLPKGVPVPLKALISFRIYMTDAVDLRPDDTFWNIADPGWAYGLYYAVIGPLLLGHATTFYDGGFTAESTYRIIKSHGITNLAGSPTAFRLLIAAGPEPADGGQGPAARGELGRRAAQPGSHPLVRRASRRADPRPLRADRDSAWWSTTTTASTIPSASARPASPCRATGSRCSTTTAASSGRTSPARSRSTSPTRRPCGSPAISTRTTPAIAGGYYRTGDTVELEPTGQITFVGRNDDVITSSGYRIGPFDVESALIEHKAVMETAVIGKPDAERTEIVKAYRRAEDRLSTASDELAEELRQHVRKRLSAHAYPREIAFVAELPKTPSGKIQRFLLRNAEKAAHEAGHSAH